MERWRGVTDVPAGYGPSVVTCGFFDGVHAGHRVLIGRAVEQARAVGQPCVVVTFDPHPSEVVRPGQGPLLLTTPEHRADLLASIGVDVELTIPFDLARSQQSAEGFVHEVFVGALRASHVVVGANFRWGHKASGDIDLLRALGASEGFEVDAVALLEGSDGAVSSTRIRRLLADGDVAGAAVGLGRDHRLTGVVVHGDHRGRELGFPTANLDVPATSAIPGDGVYAALFRLDGRVLQAAVSIGTNPTFDGTERRVEAYVLDFSGDLYGQTVSLDLRARLRGQVAYEGIEPLKVQIAADVAATRAALG